METTVHKELSVLRKDCLEYLEDAGFTYGMFEYEEDYDRECVEIIFETPEAVAYIVKDIKKTKWKDEIKVIKRLNKATFYKITI
jgi:hypothetical protein